MQEPTMHHPRERVRRVYTARPAHVITNPVQYLKQFQERCMKLARYASKCTNDHIPDNGKERQPAPQIRENACDLDNNHKRQPAPQIRGNACDLDNNHKRQPAPQIRENVRDSNNVEFKVRRVASGGKRVRFADSYSKRVHFGKTELQGILTSTGVPRS